VNTENQISATKAIRAYLDENPNQYDPRKYLTPARDAIKTTVIGKMREFGSSNKA
jgi:fructose-bisphosphate aldolase, class II